MMTRNYNYDRFGVGNHKRECFRTKGKRYFTKDFETKKQAQKYLEVCKHNNRYSFYANIKENKNNTYTLNLYKVEYWYE